MRVRNILFGSLLTAVFLFTFYLLLLPEHAFMDLDLKVGQTLEHDLVATVDFDLPYQEEDLLEIQAATRSSVPVHLEYDYSIWSTLREELNSVLLRSTCDTSFTNGMLYELFSMYEVGVFDLLEVRDNYSGELAVLLSKSGTTDCQLFDLYEMKDIRDILVLNLSRWYLTDEELHEITVLLKPNLLSEDSSRNASADAAVAGLNNIDTTITAGSILLEAEKPVTIRTIEYIRQLESVSVEYHGFTHLAGLMLLISIILAISIFYVHDIMPDTWKAANRFFLLGVIWIISLAATGILWLAMKETTGYPYATLITFGAAMTSIFFHRRHAVFFTLMFSLVLGVVHPHPFSIVLISSISGLLAAMTAWDVRRRSSIPTAIGLSTIGGIGIYLLLYMLNASPETNSLVESILGLLIAPIIGIGAASALLFLFEKIFGVYTVLAIDEANRTDHPLLKEMRDLAPGTWSHSQIVSELASRAAGAIDAWESLASAGGYFHDVGKISSPEFFIENQRNVPNPHDSMNPWESAKIIIAHVRIGVALAEKAKLPRAVIDIIQQHHGSSLAKYFYSRAIKEAIDPGSVSESEFRYPGPRPATIEAALVLLADQVASATKNLADPQNLADIITSIIDEKDLEGQLDDCHLTRRNLKTIASVFTSVLENKFYKRVKDYPSGDLNNGN
ncbi:MAG: HDIG domain-containing protein [Candidatus Aegiribacteria sp.]|nr:HDIG domain-containing protein [Candidatus Aegiribacteria sp.]